MALEPINIFSRSDDLAGLARALRELAPDLKVDGPDDAWTRLAVTGPSRWLRRPWTLTFNHDRDYYAGPDWPRQMAGMQGYFSRFPQNDRTGLVMLLIGTFRFSLAVTGEPEMPVDGDDPRRPLLLAAVKHLDGVIFTPSSLRDAQGRVLYHAGGDYDEDARFPMFPEEAVRAFREATEEEPAPPPTAQRVARRALALAAVAGRGAIELDPNDSPEQVEEVRADIERWVGEVGVRDELEPDEWKVIQRPARRLVGKDLLNAVWRLEGLVVLLWALRRADLPPHDQVVDTFGLLPKAGLFRAEEARAILASPEVRPAEELDGLRRQLLGIHWRLREHSQRPTPIDFARFAADNWFGGMSLDGIRLLDGDLAVGDRPIATASADAVATAASIAAERHLAINWLCGSAELYSRTDVST